MDELVKEIIKGYRELFRNDYNYNETDSKDLLPTVTNKIYHKIKCSLILLLKLTLENYKLWVYKSGK